MLSASSAEQYFIYALNRARRDPVAYQVERNLSVDLSYVQPRAPLAINSLLMDSTEFKSTEMATYNYFNHTSGVTGQTPNELVRSTGYALPSTVQAGGQTWLIGQTGNQVESLAAGLNTADSALQTLIVDNGVSPPGHRNHLLGIEPFYAAAREIGVGYVARAATDFGHYWSIHATLSTDTGPYLTGVVFTDGNANSRFNVGEGLGAVAITATGPTGTFSTTSNPVGGWSLKVPAGQYDISATGGGFNGRSSALVTVNTDNVEIDFISGKSNAWVDFTRFNNAPTNVVLSTSSLAENAIIGTPLGTLTTTDRDADDVFTYSLVAGAGSTDNALFSILGDTLKTAATLDFEAKSTYSIRIRSTDSGGLFTERQCTLTVTNVNEAPSSIALTRTAIAENNPVGAVVGVFTTTDVDANDSFTYALTAGQGDADNGAFQIIGNQLKANASFNFENRNSYSVRIRSTDYAGLWTERPFTITVTNLNESPQWVALSNATVAETIGTATAVGGFNTTDPDSGDTFTYSLVAGTGDADNAWFAIVGNELRPAVTLDFETQSTYRIRVRSTDSGRAFTEAAFTITVSDVSPEPPKAILLSAATVTENEPAHTVVGVLSSLDDDVGDTFTYRLVAGSGDADNSFFEIVAGRLRTAAQLDREAKTVRSVRISSTDSLGLVREQAFQIQIANVNESPTGIAMIGSNVFDGCPVETIVGQLAATDPDAGEIFTYALAAGTGDANNGAFKIVGNQVRVAEVPRFAAGPTRTVRIRTTDAGGLTFDRAFLITVDDRNDAPTDILLQPNTIAENQPVGTTVGALVAVDPDTNGKHVFALVSGDGAIDNPFFTIVDGQLRSRAPLNFEERSEYSVRVRVADQGGLFYEKALPVLVTDANDAPTNVSLSAATVAENAAAGTLIGTLAAADVDAGDSFVYSLVAGSGAADNAAFTVVGSELRTIRPFDFEAQRSLSIRVRASDAAGAAFERALKISVTNVNEAPTDIRIYGGAVAENLPAGTVAATLAAVDPDAGSLCSYAFVDGYGSDGNVCFSIRGNQVLTSTPLNFEMQSYYSIRVRATDASGLATEKSLTIRVVDVNEAPTGLALSNASVPENQPAGTSVGTLAASDADADNTFTYTLVSGAGGNGNRFFQIAGNELRTAGPFDREAKSTYSVRIQATDQGGATAFGVFTITIGDVNEAPTAITMTGGSLAENSAPGTVAARFGTTDPDRSDAFVYTLVAGIGDTGYSMFQILGNQLVAAGDFDYETARQWTVRVRSTDSGGVSVESRFTIAVTDVNERPRTLTLVQQALSGRVAAGTLVGRLSATDADAGERLTYSLVPGTGDTSNSLFTVNGNSLRAKAQMTFETGRTYSIRVRVTDKTGLTFEQTFEIVLLSATVPVPAAG